MRSYYNTSSKTVVKINGENFVVIGDEEKVSDFEIVKMAEGVTPEGWEIV